MTPRYAYVAILVTACLHLVLGVSCIINAIISFLVGPDIVSFSASALIVGCWMLLVGSLGIATGVHIQEDVKIRRSRLLDGSPRISADSERSSADKIRKLKSAYMVTAFLAVLFVMITFETSANVLYVASTKHNETQADTYTAIGGVGLATSVLEFLLVIVICFMLFYFSFTRTTGILQAPFRPIIITIPDQSGIQYQTLPNTTREYLQPFNTMQNQLPCYGAVLDNPPPYQEYDDATNPRQQDLSSLQAY